MSADLKRSHALALLTHTLLTHPHGVDVSAFCARHHVGERLMREWVRELRALECFFDADGETRVFRVGRGDNARLILKDLRAPASLSRAFRRRLALVTLWGARAKAVWSETCVGEECAKIKSDVLAKLSAVSAYDALIDEIDRKFVSVPYVSVDYSWTSKTLDQLLDAIVHQRRVKMTYHQRDRVVEPLSLIEHGGALYVLARAAGSEQVKTYCVQRIERLELCRERFTYPPRSAFEPRDFIEGSFGVYREQQVPVHLEFEVPNVPWLVRLIKERRWHPSQHIRALGGDKLQLTLCTRAPSLAKRWARSLGLDASPSALEQKKK